VQRQSGLPVSQSLVARSVGAEHDEVKPARLAHIADGFRGLALKVVTIPYDEGLKASIINYGVLQPATQRAWLAAGAAVARGL
jgi:hypothetical protein